MSKSNMDEYNFDSFDNHLKLHPETHVIELHNIARRISAHDEQSLKSFSMQIISLADQLNRVIKHLRYPD
jgi:hypothetical protein